MSDYGTDAIWHQFDLTEQEGSFPALTAQVLFHTAGIASILPWIEHVSSIGIKRVIAFSSTSLFTKAASTSAVDRDMIVRLGHYEQTLAAECERRGIAWTILRPTMIYGGKFGDRTVLDIARVISWLGFFPLLGRGSGLRQPVHAQDLAKACIQTWDRTTIFNKAYNVGGAEMLSYREMVERIFVAMNKKPRFLPVPLAGFALAVRLANCHPRYRHLTSSMAIRMDQNMVFSNDEAMCDFGYKPRAFDPRF
jgi:nucleoside-diphosphate-sugar epimerase